MIYKNFILPTFQRTGSTWVAAVLSRLVSLPVDGWEPKYHVRGTPLAQDGIDNFLALEPKIYKSHRLTAKDATGLMREKVAVVNVKRNYFDCLVSKLLYCRDVRTKQQLENEPEIASFIAEFGQLDDATFVNLFVDARREFIKCDVRAWKQHSHVVCGHNSCTIDYDGLDGNTEFIIRKLVTDLGLSPTSEQLKAAREDCEFKTFKARQPEGHVRQGVIGTWKGVLDHESVAALQAIFDQLQHKKTYSSL